MPFVGRLHAGNDRDRIVPDSLAASGRQVPTILMKGRDDEQTRQMMGHTNPIAILIKPFDESNLPRAIRKVRVNG
jgi:hypothetical protein